MKSSGWLEERKHGKIFNPKEHSLEQEEKYQTQGKEKGREENG